MYSICLVGDPGRCHVGGTVHRLCGEAFLTTDINRLISDRVSWTKREAKFESEFPLWGIMAVVDAPSPELADQATTKLMEALSKRTDIIREIRRPDGGSFFERNGLLFQSPEQLAHDQGADRRRTNP